MNSLIEFKFQFDCSSNVVHSFFLKQHRVTSKNIDKPAGRTIFVSGLPPYVNEDILHLLFTTFGLVTKVFLGPKEYLNLSAENKFWMHNIEFTSKGYSVGYVVFEEEISVRKVLQNVETLVVKSHILRCGMKKWANDYNNRIPNDGLQTEIDAFMASYDESEQNQLSAEKGMREENDEGWITVTKKSRKPGFARKESVIKQISEKVEQRRAKKELTNFYRFQIKESKMKNLVALRKKFEEDKKKIAALKASRRFKPF